jgi:hypothetical protein
MRLLIIAALIALPLAAQFRTTRFPNQGRTIAPYDFWFAKDGTGPLRISGPDTVTSTYWLKWPRTMRTGCLYAAPTDTPDGAYPLLASSCFAVGAHINAAGSWEADDTAAASGQIISGNFHLYGASGLTPGGVVGWSDLLVANLTNTSLHFAPLDGDVKPKVNQSVNFGDSTHWFMDFYSHGVINTNGLLPEVDSTSPIGAPTHLFGPVYASQVSASTINPAVDNTSTLGQPAHRYGNVYTVDLNATGQVTAATNFVANGSAAGLTYTVSGITTAGGTCTLTFTGGILTGHSGVGCP